VAAIFFSLSIRFPVHVVRMRMCSVAVMTQEVRLWWIYWWRVFDIALFSQRGLIFTMAPSSTHRRWLTSCSALCPAGECCFSLSVKALNTTFRAFKLVFLHLEVMLQSTQMYGLMWKTFASRCLPAILTHYRAVRCHYSFLSVHAIYFSYRLCILSAMLCMYINIPLNSEFS